MKLIIVILSICVILFAKEDIKIQNSIGAGYPGIVYRDHSDGGYTEYIGFALFYGESKNRKNNKSSEMLLFQMNKAKYAFVNYNETLDFSVKYVGGIGGVYSNLNHNAENIRELSGSLGVGIEMISPLEYGFLVDIFLGQQLTYEFVNEQYVIMPAFRIMFLFNY